MEFPSFVEASFPFPFTKGTYWIVSLPSKTIRYETTRNRLILAGINSEEIHKWPAVDGLILKNKQNLLQKMVHPKVLYSFNNDPICKFDVESMGTIGCFLSHSLLWKFLLQSEQAYFVVFEDDAYPRMEKILETMTPFQELIENYVTEAGGPDNFDLLRLEWVPLRENLAQRENFTKNLYRSKGLYVNLSAYIITKRGAKLLTKNLFPITDPIDMMITYQERTNKDFVSLLSKRALVFQDRNNFASDIASSEERQHRFDTFSQVKDDSFAFSSFPSWIIVLLVVFLCTFIMIILTVVVFVWNKKRLQDVSLTQ